MKKKILAAAVCAATVLSLTACKKSEEPVNGISSQTESGDSSKPEGASSSTEQNSSEANGSSSTPQSSSSASQSSSSTPQSNSSAPQSNSSAPESGSSTPQSSGSTPQSSSSTPQSSSSTPQSSSSKPQSSSSKPQSSSSKPQSSSSKPQSSSSKPQSSSSKPQSSSSKPQSSSSKPQSSSTTSTPTPTTNVVDWSKIPYADELDFNYENCEGGVKITGYTGSETILKIPETINGKPVVRIGNQALCDGAYTDIKIPNAVTILESQCLGGNKRLKSIVLPTGLKEIWKEAFAYCTSLKKLTIPDGVTNVDKGNGKQASIVSDMNSSYEKIEIVYKGKTYAPDRYGAFHDAINFAETGGFVVEDNVLKEVSRALTTAVIPSNVTDIDTVAFNGCADLTSVVIPESVTSIWCHNSMQGYFYGCTNLKSLTLPDSLTYLELKALGNERYNGIETITWKGRTYKRSQFERLCNDVSNS